MFKILMILALVGNAQAEECRSSSVVRQFNKLHGFSKNPPGYVVDHRCAIAVGGLDIIENMQYQTIAEAKLKDKIERTPSGIAMYCNSSNSKPYRTVFNCK